MGQFFTPKNITDLLIILVNPTLTLNKKTNELNFKNFAELSMGSGGIIRSYMYYYKKLIDYKINTNIDNENYLTLKKHFNIKKGGI